MGDSSDREADSLFALSSVNVSPLISLEHLAGAVCCCTLSVFGIIVLVVMGMAVGSGDPYIGGHHLVATAEVSSALTSFS